MYDMEKASSHLARGIAEILKFDQDFEEVLAYGAFTILQTLCSIFLIAIGGLVFGVVVEALVISFAASILRKYSGGVHASTPNRCAAIGVIVFVGLGLVASHIVSLGPWVAIFSSSMGFVLACYIVSQKSPKDSPNKPITEERVKRYLRRKALEVILMFLFIKGILLFLYFARMYSRGLYMVVAIALGVVWQSVTLTALGSLIISSLDRLLGKITFQIGGERG